MSGREVKCDEVKNDKDRMGCEMIRGNYGRSKRSIASVRGIGLPFERLEREENNSSKQFKLTPSYDPPLRSVSQSLDPTSLWSE
jgi:hypothetical protein